MKFENIRVMNFENALRGMRNPKDSWHLSDSEFGINNYHAVSEKIKELYPNEEDRIRAYQDHIIYSSNGYVEYAFIGPNDLGLAQRLIKGGSEHRKFMRQIFVSVDITAPLFWWKEFDTYKVGTAANSTSTMHTIMNKPITLESFEIDDLDFSAIGEWREEYLIKSYIELLENLRQFYLDLKEDLKDNDNKEEVAAIKREMEKVWKELIRWLPESWLQTRTVTMNYENLLAMCSPGQRRFHKLNEWSGKNDKELANFINFARQLPYAQQLIFSDELK